MNLQSCCWPKGLFLGLVSALFAFCPSLRAASSTIQGRPADSWSAVGVRQAWQASVALTTVNRIQAWHVVDEYLYGLGTDGKVRAFRLDTGEKVWTLPMVDPLSNLMPPVAYDAGEVRGVVFTIRDEALFLDPASGGPLYRPRVSEAGETELRKIGPVHLLSGPVSAVAATEDSVFQAAPRKRIRKYSIERDIQTFQVATKGEIHLAPVYLPQRDLLILADRDGTVAGVRAETHETVFSVELKGRPVGALVADDSAVHVVTTEPRLHVLDLDNGQERLEGYPQGYLLASGPVGGAVVTKDSIFVALEKGGLQRVGKELKWPNWLAPEARRFLAEWPDRLVLQRNDGQIMFVRPETGETQAVISVEQGFEGIPNTRNDAVILASARGDARCLRPAGAPALTAASFRPVTSQPAKAPATGAEEAVAAAPAEEANPEETTPPAGEEPAAEGAATAVPAETGPKLSPLEALIADPLKSRR